MITFKDFLKEQSDDSQQEDLVKNGAVAVVSGDHNENEEYTTVRTLYVLKGTKNPGPARVYGPNAIKNIEAFIKEKFGSTAKHHPTSDLDKPVFYARLKNK